MSPLILAAVLAQAAVDAPMADAPTPPKQLVPMVEGGLTADQVAARAVEPSPAVAQAREQLFSAAAQVDEALYSFFPRLTGRASYTRLSEVPKSTIGDPNVVLVVTPAAPGTPNPPSFAGGSLSFPVLFNQTVFSASLAVPLSDYVLRISRASAASKAAREAAELNLRASEAKAKSDAKLNFYNWLRALGAVTVAEQTLDEQKQHLADTQVLFDAGAASKADLLRAEAVVAQAEQGVVKSQAMARVAEQVVRITLRSAPSEKLQVGEALDSPVPAPDGTLDQLLGKALETRAELRSVDATLVALDHQRAFTRAGYFPVISATGSAEYSNPNPRIFPSQDKFTATWSAGASLVWSPNDALVTSKQVDEQTARINQTRDQRQQAADGVTLETTQAYEDLAAARASVDSSLRQLTASQEAYRVARVLYRNGRTNEAQLTDVETQYTIARLSALNAYVDVKVAAVRLEHAIGADLQ